jgi:ribonuclease P/MRP protein subunit POP3
MAELLAKLLSPIGQYVKVCNAAKGSLPDPPDVAGDVTLGFNSTNAAVEDQTKESFNKKNKPVETKKLAPICAVFVSRSDIPSSLVTAHFPLMCAAASLNGETVKLVQLPKGSAEKLSNASGRSDLTVIGVRGSIDSRALLAMISKVDPVNVPWLQASVAYQKPHIRSLSTPAPMKSSKSKR